MVTGVKILEVAIYLTLTLIAITGLAVIVRYLLQRRGYIINLPAQQHLKITERLHLDQRRQVVRIQDNKTTYLVLLGATNELILNTEKVKDSA